MKLTIELSKEDVRILNLKKGDDVILEEIDGEIKIVK